jgi:transcriptional regulator with XRE-family HTH domain
MGSDREVARLFGQNLCKARKQASLSQEEVGIRASLHRTEIGLLERGERVPRIDTAVKLAGAVGVPLGDLADGIEWAPGMARRGEFEIAPREETTSS